MIADFVFNARVNLTGDLDLLPDRSVRLAGGVGAGVTERFLVAGTNFQFICLFEGRSEKGPELN